MFDEFIRLVREIYQTQDFIPLHEPRFLGNEKAYVNAAIDSTFVSSVGAYVDRFEQEIAAYTGADHAIATVNGTAALHIALLLAGVKPGAEVLTQAITFVATCNAIHYCGAEPVFVDIDKTTLGLSPQALASYLAEVAEIREQGTFNRQTGKRIAACLPMHTFGHPADLVGLLKVCQQYRLPLVEDAAEALGSRCAEKHAGTFGKLGILSFNGNKIITTGGGGMILTDDPALAAQAKHLTTTAKLPHPWLFQHDRIGFNYRLPNLNAALGLAQLEQLPKFIENKRQLAHYYADWCAKSGVAFVTEPAGAASNYWLNTLILQDRHQRDEFLRITNQQGIMTRPVWEPMHHLDIYQQSRKGDLSTTEWLAERAVNIPSSATLR